MKQKAIIKVISPRSGGIASRMKDVLGMLGEDASREGLASTPERYEKAIRYLTSGYHTSVEEVVNGALFTVKFDEMVVVKDIEFFSLCEHHLLPFSARCTCISSQGQGDRAEQDSARSGYVRAPVAGAGAADAADREAISGAWPARGGGAVRGAPLLHDDARRGEAALRHSHQRHVGRVPQEQPRATSSSRWCRGARETILHVCRCC
jgi:hypothetical protein